MARSELRTRRDLPILTDGSLPSRRPACRPARRLAAVVGHPDRGRDRACRDARDAPFGAATIAIRQGVALPVIQEMLGHSDIRVTRDYVDVSSPLAHDAGARVGRALFGVTVPKIVPKGHRSGSPGQRFRWSSWEPPIGIEPMTAPMHNRGAQDAPKQHARPLRRSHAAEARRKSRDQRVAVLPICSKDRLLAIPQPVRATSRPVQP